MLKITPLSTSSYKLNNQTNTHPSFGLKERIHYSQEESDAILNGIDSFSTDNKTYETIKKQADIDKNRIKKMIKIIQESIDFFKNEGIETPKELIKAIERLKKLIR